MGIVGATRESCVITCPFQLTGLPCEVMISLSTDTVQGMIIFLFWDILPPALNAVASLAPRSLYPTLYASDYCSPDAFAQPQVPVASR